ncbi:MAG: hypothetical protein FH749_07825 [Firmicutes bacterium]|nr:hypothetical protein [Bacillota bacterium]
MALKDVSVKFSADTTQLNRGLKQAQGGISRLNGGLSRLVKTAAGLAGISVGVAGLVSLMNTYRGMRNAVQRTNELFLDSVKYVEHWASNTSRSFGMAESTAYEYAMTYGNLFKSMTRDTNENAKVTIAMMEATAVVASKTGRTMEDVGERIRSGILGNTQAIESLGIYANVAMLQTTNAFRKIAGDKSWNQLTYQQQQQIRTLAILEQAQSQYGDSVTHIAGMSLPRLGQAFRDMTSYAGMLVTAGLQPVINALGRIVHAATAAFRALANLLGLDLAGNIVPATANAASGQVALGDAIDDTTKAMEKQQKALKGLAGFDELNIVGTPDTGAGAVSAGAGLFGPSPFDSIPMPELPEMDAPEVNTGKLEKSLKYFTGLFDFTNIKESWANLKTSLTPLGENIGAGALWLFDNVLVPFGAWTINNAAPVFLNLLAGALDFLSPLVEGFMIGGAWFLKNFLGPIASWTGGVILEVLNDLAIVLSVIGGWMSDNVVVVGSLVAILLSAYATIKILTAAQWLWNAALSANPIGLVVAAIALLVAGFIVLWNKSEGFRNFFIGFGKVLVNVLKGIVNAFTGLINIVTGGLNLLMKGVLAPFNVLIKGLNKIPGVKIPTLSLNIPKIPALADGAHVTGPTIAAIGETNQEEVVIPLERDSGWAEILAQKIDEAKASGGGGAEDGGGTWIFPLYVDGKKLFEFIVDEAKRRNIKAGKTVMVGV